MKKLLLAAALVAAGQAQAVGVCAEKVQCDGSRREGETFKCAPCICPEVKCPIPAETICECAPATPIKKEVCQEVVKCGRCHAVKKHCGCREGFMHPRHHHHKDVVYVEEKTAPAMVEETRTVRTPKRVMNRN